MQESCSAHSKIPPISSLAALNIVREGREAYLVSIKRVEEAEQAKAPQGVDQAHSVLKEFEAVFRPLPTGLPPDHGAPFHINTKKRIASLSLAVAIG